MRKYRSPRHHISVPFETLTGLCLLRRERHNRLITALKTRRIGAGIPALIFQSTDYRSKHASSTIFLHFNFYRNQQTKKEERGITQHLFLSTWVSKRVAEAILNDIWYPFHAEALKSSKKIWQKKKETEKVQRLLVSVYQVNTRKIRQRQAVRIY